MASRTYQAELTSYHLVVVDQAASFAYLAASYVDLVVVAAVVSYNQADVVAFDNPVGTFAVDTYPSVDLVVGDNIRLVVDSDWH